MINLTKGKFVGKNIELYKPNLLTKINVIKNLKDHQYKDKIANFIVKYIKEQEKNYFFTQENISLGKVSLNPNQSIKKFFDKDNNIIPYSYVGPPNLFTSQHNVKKSTIRHSSALMGKLKGTNSLSVSRFERTKQNKDLLINNHEIIDNKLLKNYYNEIRQRISEEKKENKNKLTRFPFPIKKSLINQEKIFKKLIKEKRIKNKIQEKLKKKSNKRNNEDLLINKNNIFDLKNEEISIIDKNLTIDNKYRDNLWNITLRNLPHKGKYEKVGYTNVGNNYEPRYTFFNINKTIEYFHNPRYKSEERKKNKNILSNLNGDNYNLKIKQNLKLLQSIKDLEINGKNLLDVEEKRETESKGRKIIYKSKELDYLLYKQAEKSKNFSDKDMKTILDNIYEEKDYSRNCIRFDYLKNANLTSKYSHNMII